MFDRAWTADDPSSKLLDAATGWLVEHKVVLPGVTTITRLVAQVRERANQRACRRLTGPLEPDRQRQLLSLLDVDADTGVSALERLRRPPRNPTIDGLVGALARLAEIKSLGGDRIDTTRMPEGRLRQLAYEALAVKAQKVAQRSPARRLGVLAAFAAAAHRSAHDDVIDVLLLVTREFTNRIQRKAEKERLRTLGDLDAAALTLAAVAAVVVDPDVSDVEVRPRVLDGIDAETIERAIAAVRSITTSPAESLWDGLRARYPHLNRFLPALVATVDFDATTAGHPVIAALTHLRLVQRGEATIDDAPLGIATGTWQPLVCPQKGPVDGCAYRFCLLDRLRSALGRREVFVPAADRWGDPRRLLMTPEVWKAARELPQRLPGLLGDDLWPLARQRGQCRPQLLGREGTLHLAHINHVGRRNR